MIGYLFDDKDHIIFDDMANSSVLFGIGENKDYKKDFEKMGLTVQKIRELSSKKNWV